jgi:hypothetical protein
MNTIDHDPELDQRLRRALAAVAATVDEDPSPAEEPRRSRRRLAITAGATIAALPLAAGAWVQFGPEYVDRIPPANPIISGSLDGERYWVVDGREDPACEGSPSGIELIAEEDNTVGQEWNTVGYIFGEPTANGCAPNEANDPPEHTYYHDGGSTVGDGMLWAGALHPDVDQVRVSLGGDDPFEADVFEHEGDNYYVLEVPPGTHTWTIDYLVDGQVLTAPAGDVREHVLPR